MKGEEVLAFWAEKTGPETFGLLRGYDRSVAGRNVLIVDDVLTTGGSIEAVIRAVKSCGGLVMGVGIFWLRGEMRLIVPEFFSLINYSFPTWSKAECPLCFHKVPINTDFGRGRELV